MTKNQELGQAVSHMMARVLLEQDISFKVVCDGEEDLGASIIEAMSKTMVDESHKVRHHFANVIGYGYDFTKKGDSGENAREIYDRAVRNTRERVAGEHSEILVHDEVVDDRFGLYLTRLPH